MKVMWLMKSLILLVSLSLLAASEAAMLHLLPLHSIRYTLLPSLLVAIPFAVVSGFNDETGLAFFSFAETSFAQFALCGMRATVGETNIKGYPQIILADGLISEVIKCLPLLRKILCRQDGSVWTIGLFSSLAFATGEIQANEQLHKWKILCFETINIALSLLVYESVVGKTTSVGFAMIGVFIVKIILIWLRQAYLSWYIILSIAAIVAGSMIARFIRTREPSTLHKRGISI